MKIRNNVILIAALCLAVFCLSTCGNVGDSGGQGTIKIIFDNSNARSAVLDADKEKMTYTITLTSPGKAPIKETTGKGVSSASISVPEGTWNVKVHAEGDRRIGDQEKKEGVEVPITAGKTEPITIEMTVTGTRASEWQDLVDDFNEINENKLTDLVDIELADNLTAHSSTNQNSPNAITLRNGQTITLWSKKEVRIDRETDINTSINPLDVTVFKITKGTLILEGRGTTGKIIIDGKKGDIDSCERALINVVPEGNDIGTLIMNEGVTLTNNKTKLGGAVYVKGTGASFTMKGGEISYNTASASGGGVHIESGIFTKSGGIIYAYDPKDNINSNKVENSNGPISGKGHAVYFTNGNKSIDITLDQDKDEEGHTIIR